MRRQASKPLLTLLLFAVCGGQGLAGRSGIFEGITASWTGDVSLSADIVTGTARNAHRKDVLMSRRTLDQVSDYVDAALHDGGLTALQSRYRKAWPRMKRRPM